MWYLVQYVSHILNINHEILIHNNKIVWSWTHSVYSTTSNPFSSTTMMKLLVKYITWHTVSKLFHKVWRLNNFQYSILVYANGNNGYMQPRNNSVIWRLVLLSIDSISIFCSIAQFRHIFMVNLYEISLIFWSLLNCFE